MNVGDKIRYTDNQHTLALATVINAKPGPWGDGHLYDIQLEDGTIIREVLSKQFDPANKARTVAITPEAKSDNVDDPFKVSTQDIHDGLARVARSGKVIGAALNALISQVNPNQGTALNLLDQIIEMAQAKDEMWKELHKQMHKGSQTVGEDSIVYHLKLLRELIVTNVPIIPKDVAPYDGTFLQAE